MREKISQFIYAEGDTSMEETVGRLLIEKKLTLAVAESCTGGLIGHRITNIPGCSQYFVGDLVTYTYDVKQGVLGVSEETLKAHGAVSEECVREMAAGARKRTGARCVGRDVGNRGPRRRHSGQAGRHCVYCAVGGRSELHAPVPVPRHSRLDQVDHVASRARLVAAIRAGPADRGLDAVPPLILIARARS